MKDPGPAVLVAVTLLAGCGAPAPVASPVAAPESRQARVEVIADPGATAVAAALLFPGSGWELPGTEGLTLLTAETLLETVREPLSALGARAAVRCELAGFTFTLLAPRDGWEPALDVFLDGLFDPAPTPEALAAARSRLATALSLDQANPAWQARLAARQALHGDSLAPTPWEGPPCGVPEALPLFGLPHVQAGAHRFAPRMARAVVLGPRGPDVRPRLEGRLPREPLPPLPAPRSTHPGRRYVERNTVTAWTSHAFPFSPGADREALRFLAAVLADAVGPAPARPEVFAVRSDLERHGDGGALVLQVVTTPHAAAAHAEALVARVAAIAEEGVPEPVWARMVRRYRGERLRALELPEDRVGAAVWRLALDGRTGGAWPDLDALTPQRVRAAAAGLAPPARAVVGPRSARPAVSP